MAPQPVYNPLIYHLLCTFEPLTALNGAYLALAHPAHLLSILTRTPPTAISLPASFSFLLPMLSAAWLFFAFAGAAVLRMTKDDEQVWKVLCGGMLGSDLVFGWGLIRGVGGWERWRRIAEWDGEEWGSHLITFGMMVVRVCVILGIGKRKKSGERERKREGEKKE